MSAATGAHRMRAGLAASCHVSRQAAPPAGFLARRRCCDAPRCQLSVASCLQHGACWKAEDLITASENAHGERMAIRRYLRSSGEILFRCVPNIMLPRRAPSTANKGSNTANTGTNSDCKRTRGWHSGVIFARPARMSLGVRGRSCKLGWRKARWFVKSSLQEMVARAAI
jgi:hypothetical protein